MYVYGRYGREIKQKKGKSISKWKMLLFFLETAWQVNNSRQRTGLASPLSLFIRTGVLRTPKHNMPYYVSELLFSCICNNPFSPQKAPTPPDGMLISVYPDSKVCECELWMSIVIYSYNPRIASGKRRKVISLFYWQARWHEWKGYWRQCNIRASSYSTEVP